MLDATTPIDEKTAPPSPMATAAAPPPAHRCNRFAEPSPAFPPSMDEGMAMNKGERELLERLIEDPGWARGGLDPEARIDNEEWKAREARADWERQKRGWE